MNIDINSSQSFLFKNKCAMCNTNCYYGFSLKPIVSEDLEAAYKHLINPTSIIFTSSGIKMQKPGSSKILKVLKHNQNKEFLKNSKIINNNYIFVYFCKCSSKYWITKDLNVFKEVKYYLPNNKLSNNIMRVRNGSNLEIS